MKQESERGKGGMEVEAGVEGKFSIPIGPLFGPDQMPMGRDSQNWGFATIFFTTFGMSFNIILIMQGALIILFGCNWIQDLLIMAGSGALLGVLFALNGDLGKRFGIPHTVQLRSVFGNRGGAYTMSLIRAVVALFFFGIQSWIVAMSADGILNILISSWQNLGAFSRLFTLFVLFSALQYALMFYGYRAFRYVALYGLPVCIIAVLIALYWMRNEVGTWGPVWDSGSKYAAWGGPKVLLAAAAMEFGSWCTMIINFSDLSRVCNISTAKIGLAGVLGYLFGMVIAGIVGITVLSLSLVAGLGAEWNPVIWAVKYPHPGLAITILLLIFAAQITTNPQANMLSPATALANLFPKKLSLKKSSAIMIALSLATFPHVILAHQKTMMTYLSNVGAILAGIAFIMVVDYWIIRRRKISLPELYRVEGIYRYWPGGFNWIAMASAALSLVLGALFINYGGTFVSALVGAVSYLILVSLFKESCETFRKSLIE